MKYFKNITYYNIIYVLRIIILYILRIITLYIIFTFLHTY